MFKFNTRSIPDSRQCPIDGVKEVVATCIILRLIHLVFIILHKVSQGSGEGNTVEGKREKVRVSPTVLSIPLIFLFRCTLLTYLSPTPSVRNPLKCNI